MLQTKKKHSACCGCRYGDALLSKSVYNIVVLWKVTAPLEATLDLGTPPAPGLPSLQPLQKFRMDDGHVWFLKLSLCLSSLRAACGSAGGRAYVWKLPEAGAAAAAAEAAAGGGAACHPEGASVVEVDGRGGGIVRATALHPCGHLLSVMEDGRLFVHAPR